MVKKIAVLVRDRQEEALRMAVGATLKDDVIDVYTCWTARWMRPKETP